MFRYATLLGLACLTLAAASLLTASRTPAEEPQNDRDKTAEPRNRVAALRAVRALSYHARFSLN